MDENNHKHSDQFNAALPLPDGQDLKITHPKTKKDEQAEPAQAAATDLIRKRVAEAYAHEPAIKAEVEELKELETKADLSKHQQFILDLTSSGKPLSEVQTAWHEYYAALSDDAKHDVWQEFYALNEHVEQLAEPASAAKHHQPLPSQPASAHIRQTASTGSTKTRLQSGHRKLRRIYNHPKSQPVRSLAFGLSVGFLALVIVLFGFFNERFIAPFIQPSRNATNTPIISGSAVGANPEIIIPKINVEIPVVYGVSTIDDNAVETALEGGVVHYADTAQPGQDGNVVIVGHSSNNIFNPGKYKFAFVLLSRLDSGDTFYLQKDGKRYTYQVYKKEIVSPTDVSVLGPADKTATASLITCDPPGTSTNRLVVVGEQIDPNPVANAKATTNNDVAREAPIIPGNSPTLWSRLVKWLET